MTDPFGMPLSPADLLWAGAPPARDESDRDVEALFEDLVDAANNAGY